MTSKILHIDIETYSEADLTSCGVYRYTDDPSFEILLCAYAYDDEPVKIIDVACGERYPASLLKDLTDPNVVKIAHNANFERTCLAAELCDYMSPEQWRCSAVRAATLGLPRSLDAVGNAIGLPEDKKKLAIGKRLISYFCKPCPPSGANGGRTRNLPKHDTEKWELFKTYCKQDVETERAIWKALEPFPATRPEEQELWCLDQLMNETGVMVDIVMVENIISYHDRHTAELFREAKEISGLDNPNSMAQVKEWLNKKGTTVDSLNKDSVSELLKRPDIQPNVKIFLKIRQELGKTSLSKYDAISRAVCRDGKIHGMLLFYGANRTGRWAGRIVQLQNLPQNKIPDLDDARNLVIANDFETLEMLYGNTTNILSQLIRTALIAAPEKTFVVCDYSAIEARVIAWLADEKWAMDVFATTGKIYEATAANMFHVPIESVTHGSEYRKKGKVATLACIAEGTLVLTDKGEKPIEEITENDNVFDGERFVECDGAIYNGKREVITYDGLTATTDHLVWCQGQSRPLHFGKAAESGKHLYRPRNSGKCLRQSKNNKPKKNLYKTETPRLHGSMRMQDVPFGALDISIKLDQGAEQGMPELLGSEKAGAKVALQKNDCRKIPMPKPERPNVRELRREGSAVPLYIDKQSLRMDYREFRASSGTRTGSDKQRRELRAEQSPIRRQENKPWQQEDNGLKRFQSQGLAILAKRGAQDDKTREIERRNTATCGACRTGEAKELADNRIKTAIARVYDIRNCGPNHRYTANGVLVHNCGYGGGVGALTRMDTKGAIPEEEKQMVIDAWREANPHIVKFWKTVENACKKAISHKGLTVSMPKGMAVKMIQDTLFIKLPSGRSLAYKNAKTVPKGYGTEITYQGVDQEKGIWTTEHTYGGKIAENLTQAVARDCLAAAMQRLYKAGYMPLFHIHDEVIIEVDNLSADNDLTRVREIMGQKLEWADGLILTAEGYMTHYYKKD